MSQLFGGTSWSKNPRDSPLSHVLTLKNNNNNNAPYVVDKK